jgi:hypothetical protein
MKKSLSGLWLLTVLLGLGGSLLGGCAARTPQQKKTSWYKHHSGGKSVPCPCGH